MILSLEVITYKLREKIPQSMVYAGAGREVRGVRHYYADRTKPSEYLYVLYSSRMKQSVGKNDRKNLTFLVINDEGENEEAPEGWSGIYITEKYDHGYVADMVYEIFDSIKELDRTMHTIMLTGGSLQDMVTAAEPWFQYPFILFDTGFNVLAYTKNIPCNYSEYQETIKNGYSHHVILEKAKKLHIFQKVRYMDKPVLEKAMKGEERWNLYFKLYDEHNAYAHAAVFLEQSELEDGYYGILQLIADNLMLYFQSMKTEYKYGNYAYESLLLHLLRTPQPSQEQLEDQLAFVQDLSLQGIYYLAVIEVGEKETAPYKLIMRECVSLLSQTKTIIYENRILLLRRREKDSLLQRFWDPEERKLFERVMECYDYRMGISRQFSDIRKIVYSYMQGCAALEVDQQVGKKQRICNYEDYYIRHMLLKQNETLPIETMQAEIYLALKDYDRRKNTNYREIIVAYVKNNCNATEISQAMFIHRNTVIYAVKKMEEYLQVDFRDSSVQRDLIVSDEIEQLLALCE